MANEESSKNGSDGLERDFQFPGEQDPTHADGYAGAEAGGEGNLH